MKILFETYGFNMRNMEFKSQFFQMLLCICYSWVLQSIYWGMLIDYSTTSKTIESFVESYLLILNMAKHCLLTGVTSLNSQTMSQYQLQAGSQINTWPMHGFHWCIFGLIEKYGDKIDNDQRKAFQKVLDFCFMLLSALFTEHKCYARFVDDCVKLFLST